MLENHVDTTVCAKSIVSKHAKTIGDDKTYAEVQRLIEHPNDPAPLDKSAFIVGEDWSTKTLSEILD